MLFTFLILWTVCGELSVLKLESHCAGEYKNSLKHRPDLSWKELTGASPRDMPQMTIVKQIMQVQVLKSLMWIKCFGSSETRDNCEILREGFPEEEAFALG